MWTKKAGLWLQSPLLEKCWPEFPNVPGAILKEPTPLPHTTWKTWTGLELLGTEWKGLKSCYWAVSMCTRLLDRFSRVSHRALDKDSFENTGKLLIGKKGGGVGINQGISRSFLKLFSVTCSKETRKSSETSFLTNHTTMVQTSQLQCPFPRKASAVLVRSHPPYSRSQTTVYRSLPYST